MGHMDVLLAKLFSKALRQRPQRVLPSRECAGRNVPSNTRRGSREDPRASLPLVVDLVGLESLDNVLRNANAPSMLDCVTAWTSSGVMSRNGFQTGCVAL